MAIYLITIGTEIEKVNSDEENLGHRLNEFSSGENIGLYRETELIYKLNKDEKLEYSINNLPDERIFSLLKEKCYNLIDEFNLGL